jgi:hypothetical protein
MTQQPDNLFRQKLENHPIQASDRAWSRIESNLNRSSLKVFWWRMAASFLILAVSGVWLWNNLIQETNTLAVSNTPAQQQPVEISEVPSPVEPPAIAVTETKSSQIQKTNSSHRKSSPKKNDLTNRDATVISDLIETDPEVIITQTEVPHVQIYETVETPAITQSETGLYLVYTADEVNEKYLKKSSSDEATSTDKKSSRMQKLMAVANNLTDVETGIRDLRQFKNEIFALNFLERKNNN